MAISLLQNSTQSGGIASVFRAIAEQGQSVRQASSVSPKERALRLDNRQLTSENSRLEGENRTLETRLDRLRTENRGLEQEIKGLEDEQQRIEREGSGTGGMGGYFKAATYRMTANSDELSGPGRMFSAYA